MDIKKVIQRKGFTLADIIGVSVSELVADESEKQTYIVCPHCGERIKISVEK